MTNKQLAEKENHLHSIVMKLYQDEEDSNAGSENLDDVFVEYNNVFTEYVNLANTEDEALKRSLFIQWYSISEPNYLTGIPELDEETELKLLEILEAKIKHDLLDEEVTLMLNYYAAWDYIYERFPVFTLVNKFVKNRSGDYFPEEINKTGMESRGQMGRYWSSR